ncbi:MAG: F0F1 ATP synthase subunit A [Verrucomicrobiae bacterium]|nr:F0F1 ATP synthase subunit A [Verrucomicrobiae bacterium]
MIAEAEAAQHAEHSIPLNAELLGHLGPIPITNAMFVSWIVTGLLVLGAVMATRRMQLVPTGWQNFFEFVVESLYEMLEGILGSHLVKKTFWFFASIFIFILTANWLGLFPIFGNITYEAHGHAVPLFRAANSDLNMPLAIATVYFFLWMYWSLSEVGPLGMVKHIFGPKGGLEGALKWGLLPLFFLVGVIELVSILFRQVSLPLRLYGNVYAGESLLETMGAMFPYLLPLPFYALEILVGFIQALVFMLLTAVFTSMMCQHEEEH